MANSRLTWNPITSQVDSYSDAGRLGVLASMGLGQAFADTGKAFSDMAAEAAARDALQFLAQSRDPNNTQSINEAMPLALASNPGMSSEMFKYLTGAGLTLMNTQLDADNLAIAKEKAKLVQNAIDVANANNDVAGLKTANTAASKLGVRPDAITFRSIDPILTSQSNRALNAARARQIEGEIEKEKRAKYVNDYLAAMALQANRTIPANADISSPEGVKALSKVGGTLLKNVPTNMFSTDEILNMWARLPAKVAELRGAGIQPTEALPNVGATTAISIADDGTITPFNVPYAFEAITPQQQRSVAVEAGTQLPDGNIPLANAQSRGKSPEVQEAEQNAQKARQVIADINSLGSSVNSPSVLDLYSRSNPSVPSSREQERREALLTNIQDTYIDPAEHPYLAAQLATLSPINQIINESRAQVAQDIRSGKLDEKQVAEVLPSSKQTVDQRQQLYTKEANKRLQNIQKAGNELAQAFNSSDTSILGRLNVQQKTQDFNLAMQEGANSAVQIIRSIDAGNNSPFVPQYHDALIQLVQAREGTQNLQLANFDLGLLDPNTKESTPLSTEAVVNSNNIDLAKSFVKTYDLSSTFEEGTVRRLLDKAELKLKKELSTGNNIANVNQLAKFGAAICVKAGIEANGIFGIGDYDLIDKDVEFYTDNMAKVLSSEGSEVRQLINQMAKAANFASDINKGVQNTNIVNNTIQNILTNAETSGYLGQGGYYMINDLATQRAAQNSKNRQYLQYLNNTMSGR